MAKSGRVLIVAALLAGMGWTAPAVAQTASQKCEAAKLRAAGRKEACLANEAAAAALGRAANVAKCSERFTAAFARAEAKAGPGVCPTEGDAATVEALVDACTQDLTLVLSGGTPTPCPSSSQFPATGQTTCWDSAGAVVSCPGTGQDGEVQAGGRLSYTDNGDGTITDNVTGLMWAKKSDDNSTIHDKDNMYPWAEAFTVYIAGLNTGVGFARHTDWRLPNVKELQSIVNYGRSTSPAVSSAFDQGCAPGCSVTTCSCASGAGYWSSSSHAIDPTQAWFVSFGDGFVFPLGKGDLFLVRAVRGGP